MVGLFPASDVAFGVVFGVFVLAFGVLAVVAIRWGIRRDRPGREAWRRRHLEATESARQTGLLGAPEQPSDPPRSENGR